jgi:hypothetical protein
MSCVQLYAVKASTRSNLCTAHKRPTDIVHIHYRHGFWGLKKRTMKNTSEDVWRPRTNRDGTRRQRGHEWGTSAEDIG